MRTHCNQVSRFLGMRIHLLTPILQIKHYEVHLSINHTIANTSFNNNNRQEIRRNYKPLILCASESQNDWTSQTQRQVAAGPSNS